MNSENLIKASLSRLLNEGKLHEVKTDNESNPSSMSPSEKSTKVETLLQEDFPQELFAMDLGGSTLVEIQRLLASPIPSSPIIDILNEMITAEGAINDRSAALGWVGNPTTDFSVSRGGYFRHFQNASIYWMRLYGAKELHGAIRERYFQMDAELSYLGFPQTDELSVSAGGEEVLQQFSGRHHSLDCEPRSVSHSQFLALYGAASTRCMALHDWTGIHSKQPGYLLDHQCT